jgi:3-deoxy-7-phosphoheptulonate synthase
MELTDNTNIKQFRALISPKELKEELPLPDQAAQTVLAFRTTIQDILMDKDERRILIVGPCSLHDPDAALQYAQKLKALQEEVQDKWLLVMRAYFEKPRTTLGWKGMIYDPHLDHSYDIETGLRRARGFLLEVAKLGLPAATEFLDPIVPQYLADLVSWAAIGARTTESQIHRQMASGLSMPVGFKNATDGNLRPAIDAIRAALSAHSFMGISQDGQVVVAETRGNAYGHLVLRGGSSGPNYGSEYVAFAEALMQKTGVTTGIIIDSSHANSDKDHTQQARVFHDVVQQMRTGNTRIAGLMLESFLEEGQQAFDSPDKLTYGVSLTDACIGWDETEALIRQVLETDV